MNNCTFQGNIGADPKFFEYLSGDEVKELASFSIATNKKIGEKEYTNWHRIVVLGKAVDAVRKFYTKGKQVLVVNAEHQEKTYERDGVKRVSNSFIIGSPGSYVRLLGRKNDTAAAKSDNPAPHDEFSPEVGTEDMPFKY